MRRLAVLAAALGMMWGLHQVRAQAGAGEADPLTLAAIGFVVLAAFTVGELGARVGLPKVTGYIVAGVLLGPSVSDILSERVVGEMGMFNTLALGLIATNAGLELDLGAIRRISRTLFATVGAKLLLLPVLVGAPLFLVQRYHPVLPVEGTAAILVLATVVAVLAIGTSPAIALAVINDSRAHGRLSDLVLAIAVVKDLVVVVCLAAAVAVGRGLLGGGGFDAQVLRGLATELGGSLLVGAAVGLLLVQYIRRVHAEMLLAVLVLILLVAELSHVLHLELLLVFIAAGFVVRNFSKYEHELLDPLSRMSVPVYVVFFTTAGGGIDLATTVTLLPLALLLVAGRAAAFALAARIGCRFGGESPAVTRNAWLGYVPQAGVTLGLVLLASQGLPQLAEPILRLGMALVAVNLLVGPVTLAAALRRAGETRDEAAAPSQEAEEAATSAHEEPVVTAATTALPEAVLKEPLLANPLHDLANDLTAEVRRMAENRLGPTVSAIRAWAAAALTTTSDRAALLRQIGTALDGRESDPGQEWELGTVELLDRLVQRLHALPTVVWVPFDPGLLEARPGDSARLRTRLLLLRLGHRLARARGRPALRRAPVRRAARFTLEPRLAEAIATVSASLYRTLAAVLNLLEDAAVGTRDGAAAAAELERILELWMEQVGADLDHALRCGLDETARALSLAGSPRLGEAEISFSAVEGRVRAARDRILSDAGPWRGHLGAAREGLRATLHLEQASLLAGGILERRALGPLRVAREALMADLEALVRRLAEISSNAGAISAESGDGSAQLLATCRELYPSQTQLRLRRTEVRFRQETQSHQLVSDLQGVVTNAPSGSVVMAPRTAVTRAARPAAVEVHAIDIADELESVLVDELVPRLDAILSRAVEDFNGAEGRTRDLASSVVFGIELAMDERHVAASGRGPLIDETLTRAVARSRSIAAELAHALDDAEQRVRMLAEDTTARLRRVLGEEARSAATRAQASVRVTRRRLLARFERNREALRARWRFLEASARWIGNQGALRDLRIRSGQESLDRAAICEYLRQRHPAANDLRLPTVIRRLYAPIPLDDRRLFVAHRPLLDRLVEGVDALQKGEAPAILITGPRGTGRSSLLNVFRLHLAGRHVVRLDDSLAVRGEGLVRTLAVESGAIPTVSATAAVLGGRPTVVVIDNLEHWFLPTAHGLSQLEDFLQLVLETTGRVLWVVSVGSTPLSVLAELLPIRSSFSRILQTRVLEWDELARVMEARERLSGFDTAYVSRRLERWMLRLRARDERELHFRALARVTRGNLRAALITHARSLRPGAAGELRATTPHLSPLPFLDQLPPLAVAVLAQTMRWGPMDEESLATSLAMAPASLRHATTHLLGCGLLEPLRPGPSAPLVVSARLESTLAMTLAERGLHVGVET